MPTPLDRIVKTASASQIAAALFAVVQRRHAGELRKAAADTELAARLEKTAIFGTLKAIGGAGLGVAKSMFGRTVPGTIGAGTRPIGGALPPRWKPSLGRTATTAALGGAGAGAVAVGDDNAQYQHGVHASNPMTWGRILPGVDGPSHQQVFDANKAKMDAGIATLKNRMADAAARGDTATVQRLAGQLGTGKFNNEPWYNPRLGGLNPFAERQMSHYADGARAIQSGDAARLEQNRAILRDHAAGLDPAVKANLEKSVAEAEARLKVNLPWGPPGAPAPEAPKPGAQPGNYVYATQRPQPLLPTQMRALNANDFRNNSAWEANQQAQTQPRV